MADWQKTRYAQPKSWSEMQAELREKKDPKSKNAPPVLFLGALGLFLAIAGFAAMVYSALRFLASIH